MNVDDPFAPDSRSVEQIAADWVKASTAETGDIALFDLVRDKPDVAWLVVLEILKQPLTPEQTADLAAGPLEDQLVHHGPAFVDRVEETARADAKFKHLLNGVWNGRMPKPIRRRLEPWQDARW